MAHATLNGISMTSSNPIAVIANRDHPDAQILLTTAARQWRTAGHAVVGLVAADDTSGGPCSAGHLYDIASGKQYSIQLEQTPPGTSCHLDNGGVADAGAAIPAQIDTADVVILSKFGKLESQQQGLWPAFAAAMAAGKPVLTTVSDKHEGAFKAFAPTAVWLDAAQPAIEQWWHSLQA